MRDGARANGSHISLILGVIDRLSSLLAEIGRLETEPEGDDSDLLAELEAQTRQLQAPPEPEALAPAWTAPAPASVAAEAEGPPAESGAIDPAYAHPKRFACLSECSTGLWA